MALSEQELLIVRIVIPAQVPVITFALVLAVVTAMATQALAGILDKRQVTILQPVL